MDIKSVIHNNGYTIKELAAKIGVNRVTLTSTLKNNPTYNKLRQLADALGCDVMDFFKDEATHQTLPFLALVRVDGQWREFSDAEELRRFLS